MPLQNRVTPFGELIATPARGTCLAIAAGTFIATTARSGARRWASRQWICCVLSFKGRRHEVWGRGYTDLFFLDEVTALRRRPPPLLSNAAAPTQPPSRKNGRKQRAALPYADEMDRVLHAERLDGRAKRTHRMMMDDLPDGAVVMRDVFAYAVRGAHLLRWSEQGYDGRLPRGRGAAEVLTPPSTVAVLKAGYRPQWHPSVDR